MSNATTPTPVDEFAITVEQVEDYEFKVRFDKPQFPECRLDEPAPIGHDTAPNAARVLSAAIGNCLSASLLFCARKAKIQLGPIRTVVRTQICRGEGGRLRIGKIEVRIDPRIPDAEKRKALRCLDLFEDYCVVTQSVRRGIDVRVSVEGFDDSGEDRQSGY
ncbi:MAG: OsmC family protein [Bryobacteraceae bacterium]